MSTTKQEVRGVAKAEVHSPWPHVRLAETDRLETFSDSVLSITVTLLVTGDRNRAAGARARPIAGQADSTMGELHRVPCVVLLCRRYLAQSSGGVRTGALLRPQPSPSQPFPSADVGTDPFSDGHPLHSNRKRQRIRCQGGGDPLCRH